jgi:hypothetical protein
MQYGSRGRYVGLQGDFRAAPVRSLISAAAFNASSLRSDETANIAFRKGPLRSPRSQRPDDGFPIDRRLTFMATAAKATRRKSKGRRPPRISRLAWEVSARIEHHLRPRLSRAPRCGRFTSSVCCAVDVGSVERAALERGAGSMRMIEVIVRIVRHVEAFRRGRPGVDLCFVACVRVSASRVSQHRRPSGLGICLLDVPFTEHGRPRLGLPTS